MAELTRLTATSGDAQHAEARERVDLVATRAVVEPLETSSTVETGRRVTLVDF